MNSPLGVNADRPRSFRHYRWIVCALLFFATTINYIDRLVFGILGPELQKLQGWSNADYANIVFWFEVAYALGMPAAGKLLDKVGTRLGFACAVFVWSIGCMIHAAMNSAAGFSVARFVLGFGEAAVFPASVKAVAEWFPKKERALAMGIVTAGTNVGALTVPIIVPLIFIHFGWQAAFLITGALGLFWLIFWLVMYRLPARHPHITPEELALIESDPVEPQIKVTWRQLLRHREIWGFIVAKFLTDSVWRWYLYLLPLFFVQQHHLDIKNFGPPFIVIYLVADFGSIGGGWVSSHLIKKGWSINAGRKTAMLICALCTVPVVLVTYVSNIWIAVSLVALAAAAHQGWSANLFTTASDVFPRQTVGSVVGLGQLAGALGAMAILKITSYVLGDGSGFAILFAIAGSAYCLALLIFHLLSPTLKPAQLT